MAEMYKISDYIDEHSDIEYAIGAQRFFDKLQNVINTLEVKEVEWKDIRPISEAVKIGETEIYFEDDGGEPPYDGKQWLDLGCIEHEIPTDKFNDGDIVEILIRKIGTKQK